MSPLALGEILVLFVNIFTADYKYPVQDCENLQLTIQMQLLEKQKTFCNFLLHFWYLHEILNIFKEKFFFQFCNLDQILNIFKKKMFVIANVFPKLQTVKTLVRALSKTRRLRTRFGSQHVKAFQIVAKFP